MANAPESTSRTPQPPTYDIGETVSVNSLGDVAVESATVQRSIIDHHTWRELHEPDDGQLLVFRVDAAQDTETLTFIPRLEGEYVADPGMIPLKGSTDVSTVIVPVRSVDAAAIVLRAGDDPAWRLPASTRERLARAPEFHLHSATLASDAGETVLDLTVENRGDRAGTFRGITVSAEYADADAPVRFDIAAGETVTATVRNDVVANWDATATFEHDISPDTRRFVVAHP